MITTLDNILEKGKVYILVCLWCEESRKTISSIAIFVWWTWRASIYTRDGSGNIRTLNQQGYLFHTAK